jgi:nucleotide-binding universal stress UspA family protein
MITINSSKILIPVDFSPTSLYAVKHGAFLAKRNKGELLLLHVRKKKDIRNFGSAMEELRLMVEEKKAVLEKTRELAAEISHTYNITVTPLITSGNCPSEIVRTAEKHKAGLIVMGTRGSESTSSLFFGSNAFRVISKSEIPVITVRSESPKLGYSRILLPIDSSEHSRQKVVSALQIAKMYAATVHVLGILGESEGHYRYKMEVILRQIRKMVESRNLVFASNILHSDDPAQTTLSYARITGADLIITMTDQNTGYTRLISGSYDRQLVDESEIPVMSIQPEIHEENIGPVRIGGMW